MGRFAAPTRFAGLLPVVLLLTTACLDGQECSSTDISCNELSLAVLGGLVQTQSESASASPESGSDGSGSGGNGIPAFRHIYLIITPKDGNLGGITGADAACLADNPGLSGTFRAMIVDGAARIASVTANAGDGQMDWVLQANTEYRRQDGTTVVGTTNSAALFTFPLDNAFGSGPAWTGLDTDWTAHPDNCTNWGVTTGNGSSGNSGQVSQQAIRQNSPGCSSLRSLICVEVP